MNLPPITLDGEDSGNVVSLNAPFKRHDPERQFERVPSTGCLHLSGMVTYQVDEKLAEVTCGGCGEKLNPMFVLGQLMSRESRYAQFRGSYQDEMKRLNERSRTKCQHCGEMTRISSK